MPEIPLVWLPLYQRYLTQDREKAYTGLGERSGHPGFEVAGAVGLMQVQGHG